MARQRTATGISALPSDTLGYIFGKLTLQEQCRAKAVCKDWKSQLSSSGSRVKQGWIIVNCINHLLCYNVDENHWLPRINMASLPLQGLRNPRLCCVFQELLLFCDDSKKPRFCCWNVATGKSRLLPIHRVPVGGDGVLIFGAYTGQESGGLNLLVYENGRLIRCDVESGGAWKELFESGGAWKEREPIGPVFNNLTPSNREVTFVDSKSELLLYNVDTESLQTLNYHGSDDAFKYTWDHDQSAGRFHFPAHGCFVIGQSRFVMDNFEEKDEIGLLRYDARRRKFVVVSRVEEEVARRMREECGGVLLKYRWLEGLGNEGIYHHFYCSDGVENIGEHLAAAPRLLQNAPLQFGFWGMAHSPQHSAPLPL